MSFVFSVLLTGAGTAILIYACASALHHFNVQNILSQKIRAFRFKPSGSLTSFFLIIAENIGSYLNKTSVSHLPWLKKGYAKDLLLLGEPYRSLDSSTFLGMKLLAAGGSLLFSIVLWGAYSPFLLLLLTGAGFFIPDAFIKIKVKERQTAFFRQLPDVLDLLVLMTEAGLEFNAALNKLLQCEKGELIDEFRKVEQEMRLGKPRGEAFGDMAVRLQFPPLTSVVGALVTGLRTGGGMAGTMRTLAEQFRIEQFQYAEKKAQEAPIKLMLPLVLLIFPTIFIILFGPIFLSFLQGNLW